VPVPVGIARCFGRDARLPIRYQADVGDRAQRAARTIVLKVLWHPRTRVGMRAAGDVKRDTSRLAGRDDGLCHRLIARDLNPRHGRQLAFRQ